MKKQSLYIPLLVLTALIWGVAFVAQSVGGQQVGAFTFNSVRSLLGGAVLLPLIPLLGRLSANRRQAAAGRPRGGPEFCCGAAGREFGEVIVQKSESPGVSLLTRPGLRLLLSAGAEFHFSSCCRLV